MHVIDLVKFIKRLITIRESNNFNIFTLSSKNPIKIKNLIKFIQMKINNYSNINLLHGNNSFLIDNKLAKKNGFKPASVKESISKYIKEL